MRSSYDMTSSYDMDEMVVRTEEEFDGLPPSLRKEYMHCTDCVGSFIEGYEVYYLCPPHEQQVPITDEEAAEAVTEVPTPPTEQPHEQPPQGVQAILAEREKTHGSFEVQANISQGLKDECHKRVAKWQSLAPHQQEAIDMILHKIARVMAGDPDIKDHWDDIAGYATLVARTLEP